MKKYSLIVSSILLVILFVKLLSNYSESFESVEKQYGKSIVNLEKGVLPQDISSVIKTHNYLSDKRDADFVGQFLSDKLKENSAPESLYDLNKRVWQIPAAMIDSVAEIYKSTDKKIRKTDKKAAESYYVAKLDESRRVLGIDEEYKKLDIANLKSEIKIDDKNNAELRVVVSEELKDKGLISKLLNKKPARCAGVVVRLSEQYIDSLNNPLRKTIAYLKTDNNGCVVFEGLNPNSSYSVLPITPDYEYGSPKGTIGGNLSFAIDKQKSKFAKFLELFGIESDAVLECQFTQLEHRIRIFDVPTMKQIKEDESMTIRSPGDFRNSLTKYVVLFFAAWWGLWLFGRLRKRPIDDMMLAIMMMLTGLCLLIMFSLNDPQTDRMLGEEMANGILVGVAVIALLQFLNLKKLYQNQLSADFDIMLECIKWMFKPFKVKVKYLTEILSDTKANVAYKIGATIVIVLCLPWLLLDLIRITALNKKVETALDRMPKGIGYLIMALLLTALLFTPLGASVGGMKVNLNIGFLFQPSEITKYLIIIFMAAYFSVNANKVVQFSEQGNTKFFADKLRMLATIFIGLGALMMVYLMLGDMGPALVIAFTFILLYSMIKSKIDLEGLSAENRLKKIFTCDFAMLVYGVVSFLVLLYIGNLIDSMGILCIVWFAVWIVVGIVKRQIFETPIFFNFIVAAFIFGGSILGGVGLESTAERLDSRNEMCTNTWGTLPINGAEADAGDNTQVAEGLWGLASGGLWGQGLGNGSPSFIPAFHTDMILESIGEQLGFVGVVVIILLLTLLLRRTIVLGYQTSHPFTFYLCLGVAIVTAVQFVIISLGSTGIIPLTGVTVPFFSYGKVSMILNLTAFGLILSIASFDAKEKDNSPATILSRQNISKYGYTVSLLSIIYSFLVVIICSVFFYYQFLDRDDTLIRPVYVNNSDGVPVVNYNPRISQLTDKLLAGDIYDRNGILLATSDKSKLAKYIPQYYDILGSEYTVDTLKRQKRFYPFGEHLAFMLGNQNSDLFIFSGSESSGYAAEIRHNSDLKGYDNRKDENGNMLPKVVLPYAEQRVSKWHPLQETSLYNKVQLYNYAKLIPYLKAGVNSEKVRLLNERSESWLTLDKIEPKDIHLTIDAKLQTQLQQKMTYYLKDKYKNSSWAKKIRASVVILDAKQGDLLASANYPLVNSERLKDEIDDETKRIPTYSDSKKARDWTSYTDMDLGLVYATAPGSTAKVMSALAGLRKCGVEAADPNNKKYKYYVHQTLGAEWTGWVNMKDAIVRSSNSYFVNLVNDHNLYEDLRFIYRSADLSIAGTMPYGLMYSDSATLKKFNEKFMTSGTNVAVDDYRRYKKYKKRLDNNNVWQWAWGQGTLDATPLAMARIASIVANDGKMVTTKYTKEDDSRQIEIVSKNEAEALSNFMIEEANTHTTCTFNKEDNVGGKTGTAHRNSGRVRSMDAWYIFYVKQTTGNPLAVAVRIERGQSSTNAKQLARDIVFTTLKELNYVK